MHACMISFVVFLFSCFVGCHEPQKGAGSNMSLPRITSPDYENQVGHYPRNAAKGEPENEVRVICNLYIVFNTAHPIFSSQRPFFSRHSNVILLQISR